MDSSLMAIRVNHRASKVPAVQGLLTEFGCHIKTRVGFHEASEDSCSEDGIIILQLCGQKDATKKLHKELNALDGVSAKFIEF